MMNRKFVQKWPHLGFEMKAVLHLGEKLKLTINIRLRSTVHFPNAFDSNDALALRIGRNQIILYTYTKQKC